ncbi:MAG TPA: DUF1634 domain-containing protein [Candidatus Limnocylindrales bacterium]|nr:DUF1634 domain-containing protein [Candidatus Limnocylindrales bacterium]
MSEHGPSRPGALEARVGRLLRIGTYGAVALIGIGVVLMLASGRSPLDVAPPLDPARLLADVAALQPAGFVWLGVLVVLATPAARVVVALLGFFRAGEREMAAVAVIILAVIALGVALSAISPDIRG